MRNVPYIIEMCNNEDCPIRCLFEKGCACVDKKFYKATYCLEDFEIAYALDKSNGKFCRLFSVGFEKELEKLWFTTMDSLYSYSEGEN